MKPRRITHLEIPHPFYADLKSIITAEEKAKTFFHRAFVLFRQGKSTAILHEVQSFSPDSQTPKRCLQYTDKLFAFWWKECQHLLGKDVLQIVFLTLLSYAIWNIAFIPRVVDSLFALMGDYLNNYARVVLIATPLIYMVYRKFLIGDTVASHLKSFAFLKIKPYLGRSVIDELERDLETLSHKLKNEVIQDLLQDFVTTLQKQEHLDIAPLLLRLHQIIQTADLSFKEREILQSLYRDMEYWQNCHFQREFSIAQCASPLKEFFSSPFYEEWSSNLKIIRDEFHTQPTQEKAREIAEMFFQLEKKLRAELTKRWEPKYLEILVDHYRELGLLFSLPFKKTTMHMLRSVTAQEFFFPSERRFSLTPLKTFLLSLLMVTVALTTFSFHLANREDFLIVRQFVPGWQSIWGEKVEIIQEGLLKLGGKKLLFSMPRPFAFAHRSTLNPQNVEVSFILKEVEPSFQGGIIGTLKYLWDKGMAFFKEGYGNDFIVLVGDIVFQIEDPQKWKQYDFDGLGKERLARDLENYLTSYFEQLQGTYREELFAEESDRVKEHLVKVSKSANFKTWVRRFLYPSPLDTYRVGSVYDMYLVGLDWLLRHPRMENDPEWKEFVEHEIEVIKEKMEQEHDELIANPLKVRKMFQNPNLFEFADYPGLYQTLFLMALTELTNNRLIEDLKDGTKVGKMSQDALSYLQREKAKFLSTIGIQLRSVDLSMGRISYLYYVRMLQRRQNLL